MRDDDGNHELLLGSDVHSGFSSPQEFSDFGERSFHKRSWLDFSGWDQHDGSRGFRNQLLNTVKIIVKWTKGPDPPRIQKIRPFYPALQHAPLGIINRYFPQKWQKWSLVTAWTGIWLTIFAVVLNHSAKSSVVVGHGKPEAIWCGAAFWKPNNQCGLDGNRCRPFDNSTFAFRCPSNCKATLILNPRAVGDQEVNYQTLVVGNSTAYRGDSFICQAAIHAGVITNEHGGCGVARLTGSHRDFGATERHGIASFGFDSLFPKSFSFITNLPASCVSDLRWPLLVVTATFTGLLSLFTTSPSMLFFPIFTMTFFHVSLVSDPPFATDYATLLSICLGRFLPAMLVGAIIYRFAVVPQHSDLTATTERTLLWLGALWIGAMDNYTFSNIPLQRLTPHDVRSQPGAILSLVVIVTAICLIALKQAFYLRQEGRFRRYLAIYASMVLGLFICMAIPQLNLRLHHYILALLLLPGTRMQNRSSLIYQGLLIGLFINGTARWGFDSIMQTSDDLREDGQLNSVLPTIAPPVIGPSNITFHYPPLPPEFDGISILINDVERHRWYHGEGEPSYTISRTESDLKEYFRFAFMSGSLAGDYTRAGIWATNGSWIHMQDGPSR